MYLDNNRLYPSILYKQKGNDGLFKCNSSGTAWWTFNNTHLPSNVKVYGEKNTTLSIVGVKYINEGYYECLGRTEEGWLFFAKSQLLLKSNLF